MKNMAGLVEVFPSPLGGRGVRAKRDIKAGEVLVREEPYVLCHGAVESPSRCDYCFAEKSDLRRCLGCKYVRYCSKDCQKSAWPDHIHECKGIKKAPASEIFQDEHRFVAKVLQKRKAMQGNSSASPADENGFPNTPDELQHHIDNWEPRHNRKFERAYTQLTQFMNEDDIKNKNKVKEIVSICRVNSVQIQDGRGRSLGYGLFLKYAMFNHSCDPNCLVATDHESNMMINRREIRAVAEIKKGEECFVSFVDEYQPTAMRNDAISAEWFFTCNCNLCQNKERNARICGLRCPNCSSAVPFSPTESPIFVDVDDYNRRPEFEFNPQSEIKCVSCQWLPDRALREKYWLAFLQMNEKDILIKAKKETLTPDILL
ncbi:N-lysine methyltransferase SMYD2-B-like [Amphiura filiformis]|uniref:N-lysine methyltransferase SMYD2-B-like n=1 Tax=Amphiura filiformis TaxID=82378 RepID=UPI003B217E4E